MINVRNVAGASGNCTVIASVEVSTDKYSSVAVTTYGVVVTSVYDERKLAGVTNDTNPLFTVNSESLKPAVPRTASTVEPAVAKGFHVSGISVAVGSIS